MTRITRLLALTGALVCGGLGLAACGSSGPVPSNSVAVVGSMPITKATLAHWMAIAAHSTTPKGATTPAPVPDPPEYTRCIEYLRATEHTSAPLARSSTAQLKSKCAASYAADKKAALEFLIPAEWAEGEAKELGVNVSDKEVEKEFEKIKKAGYKGGFENYLARTGYTVPDLLLKTKVERVLPPKLEKAVIGRAERAITKAIIAKYYKAHEATYHREEGRTLYILLTPTAAKANAAKAELEAGKSFKELGHVSILHTSKRGRRLPDDGTPSERNRAGRAALRGQDGRHHGTREDLRGLLRLQNNRQVPRPARIAGGSRRKDPVILGAEEDRI